MLETLFNADVMKRLQGQAFPSEALRRRVDVFLAKENPEADLEEPTWQRILLAHRTAWLSYVDAMSAAGALDADVAARLTGIDDDDFRSALSECLMCHFLLRILGLKLFGRHEGRKGTAIDFGIRHASGDISVEVKSPFAERPRGRVWSGDHSHVLEPALDGANKQFAEDRRNILALVPLVDFPVLIGRRPFVKAFLGETKVVVTMDRGSGKSVGEPRWEFMTEGKFLKLWPEPRFTRTAAVLVVREFLREENQFEENFSARVELRWFLLHNPHSKTPVPTDLWGGCPQLVRDGDNIRWTDGWPVDGSPPRKK